MSVSRTGVLDKATLLELVKGSPPLIENAVDLTLQVQPNGIDLTLRDIAIYESPGTIHFSNERRSLARTRPQPFTGDDAHLGPGAYLLTFNELVHIPTDLLALGRTRSSLLRSGAALHTAVWDAGYSGRSQSLLTVYNPHGIVLGKSARIMQLVFFRLGGHATGYSGAFQGENL